MVGTHPFSDWESYYVILGSSGAALVGLQFVVITLIAERRALASRETLNAFGTPTVVPFVGALVISSVMSAPWTSVRSAAAVLALCGIVGITCSLVVIHRARRQPDYDPTGADWIWYVLLPLGACLTLAIAAARLPRHPRGSLFTIGAVVLGLLLLGIRNAWDTVTYVLTRDPSQKIEPPCERGKASDVVPANLPAGPTPSPDGAPD